MPKFLLLSALVFSFAPARAATTAEIKAIAQELVCLCGNCSRESLATCLCSDFAVPEREAIGRALDQGQTSQQIIDGYIARFGIIGYAAPPQEGFNLLAWVAPFVALLLGIVLIRTLLISWKGRNDATPIGAAASVADDERNQYRDRLQHDLERFDENNE